METDGVLRVARAAWVETTLSAEPARQRGSIHADQPDQDEPKRRPADPQDRTSPSHERVSRARESSSFTSVTRSRVRAPWIVPRATNATSYPSRTVGASSRHAARRMRRARLRKTARPTRRPATNAALPEPGATNSTTRFPWNARPFDSSRATSLLREAAIGATPRVASGPSRVDARRSHGRRAFSSEVESRGAWSAGGCWVERFASTCRFLRSWSPPRGARSPRDPQADAV
jgi:hypothetical protein